MSMQGILLCLKYHHVRSQKIRAPSLAISIIALIKIERGYPTVMITSKELNYVPLVVRDSGRRSEWIEGEREESETFHPS